MKKTVQILILGILICNNTFSQDISDAKRLGELDYMKYADNVNCDSTSGSNLEHRICLNLEFQKVDSILNVRFNSLLKNIENDSIKNEINNFQRLWIENRRIQSELISNGFQGHSIGIYYLDSMIKTTKRRIEDIEYIIEIK